MTIFLSYGNTLQKELEAETGCKFGIVQFSMFIGMTYEEEIQEAKVVDQVTADETTKAMVGQGYISVKIEEKAIAHEEANEIVKHFEKEGYIDKRVR